MKRDNIRVCWRCLKSIESRNGKKLAYISYIVDETDEIESKCDWCEGFGYDILYEF